MEPKNCDREYTLSPEEAIKMIVNNYGIDIFTDKKRLLGLLSDYLASDIKVKKILSNAVKDNVCQELYEIKDLNEGDRKINIAKIKIVFKEGNGMEETIANYAVDCFIYGLGWMQENDCFKIVSEKEIGKAINYKNLTLEECLNLASNNDSMAQLRLGKIYYEGVIVKQDLKKSFDYTLMAAMQGNAEAMHDVGFCYQCGEGIKEDKAQAYEWYVKSKEQNFYKAYYRLGYMYEKGIHVSINFKKAMEYYLISAKADYPKAIYAIAHMYSLGKGVQQDYKQAFLWYEKAANLNQAIAMYALGFYYENGYGVLKSNADAFRWYLAAAEKNDSDAEFAVAHCFRDGIGTQIDEEKEMFWLKKASMQKNKYALLTLGKYYQFGGSTCPIDLKKAKECLMEAVKGGYNDEISKKAYADAHFDIAIILLEHPENEKTKQEAISHLNIAGEFGDLRTQKILGEAYKKGNDIICKDIKLAYYWYEKSAENGDADSQYELAMMLRRGDVDITQDISKSIEWMEKAAEQNNSTAVTKLGICYMTGEGVTPDIKRAISLFEKAIQLKDAEAAYYLGYIYNNGIGTDKNLELAKVYLETAAKGNVSNAVEELKKNFRKKSDGTWIKKMFR